MAKIKCFKCGNEGEPGVVNFTDEWFCKVCNSSNYAVIEGVGQTPSSGLPSAGKWKQEEFDFLLNACQLADSHERLSGCIDLAAKTLNRDSKAVFRILWGLAVRITQIDYEPGLARNKRVSNEPTFFDIQMIRWAAGNHTKDKRQRSGRADETYMVKLLESNHGEGEGNQFVCCLGKRHTALDMMGMFVSKHNPLS